jgi:hypothetical protein
LLAKHFSRRELKNYLTFVILSSVFALGTLLAKDQWFFFDEWSLYLHRQLNLDGLMTPHNGHWSTIPFLLNLSLFKIFGFSSYTPYVFLVLLTNFLLCIAMFKLLIKNQLGTFAAFLASALLIAPAVGFENLLWAFQLGYMSSMLFGTLAFLVASRRVVLTINDGMLIGFLTLASVASSGIGLVFFLPLFVFMTALKREKNVIGLSIGIPAIAYLAWFLVYGESGTEGAASPFTEMIKFILHGVINSIKSGLLITNVDRSMFVAVITLLIAGIVMSKNKRGIFFALTYLLSGTLFFTLTAVSRASFGVEYAASYRYMHIFFIFFVPLVAVFLDALFSRWKPAAIVAALSMSFVIVSSGALLIQRAEGQSAQERASQRSLASAHYLQREFPKSIVSTKPLNQFAPQVEFDDLDFMHRNHAFDEIRLSGDDVAYSLLANGVSVMPATSTYKDSLLKCVTIETGSNEVVTTLGDRYLDVISMDGIELYPNVESVNSRPYSHFEAKDIVAGNIIRLATSDFTWTIRNTGSLPIRSCYQP